MYAVVKSGTHQYKAKINHDLIVEKLSGPVGTQVEINEVYLIADGEEILVGQPTVSGAKVHATIMEEVPGPKIRILKHHARKNYRRRKGHRQTYMRLRVDEIVKGTEA
ncbi:MAG TPA: 50S ribosomal protein L21 [Thermoflexia bacterium]|nr:50S ribosomal protein L21 [Thermoflexia bacterium]